MRNRAKCKLCETIIESLHSSDYQKCNCGEIAIDGGEIEYKAYAKDWANFYRVDDDCKIIEPKIIEKGDEPDKDIETIEISNVDRRTKLLDMLKNMIDSYENLPQHAKLNAITHYDLQAALLIIYEIVRME